MSEPEPGVGGLVRITILLWRDVQAEFGVQESP
jgi:hypothetical protein